MQKDWNSAIGNARLKSSTEADRRRFFRVDDYAAIKFRIITTEQSHSIEKRILEGPPSVHSLTGAFAATTCQMDQVMRNFQNREPDIAHYLKTLNEKLDLLARSMFMEDNDLITQPTQAVNISASGISFQGEAQLPDNARVELKLLAFPSLINILSIAKVVRCDYMPEANESAPYFTALDFETIREQDKELLVQHVIHQETTQLRNR